MLKRLINVMRRGLLPIVAIGLGIASLVWGAKHHTQEIFEEQEIEISIAPPEMMMPQPGPGGFPGDPAMGGGMPFMPGPPPEMQKIKEVVLVSEDELESQIIFEITIGGLVRLESGELQRTYTGAPPSLCPT